MIGTRITSLVAAVMIAGTIAAPSFAYGERKNDGPFVRAVASQSVVSGEPKNQAPFTGPVEQPPTVIVTDTPNGFRWVDAAIGAGAGVGLVFVAAGLAALALGTRRRTASA